MSTESTSVLDNFSKNLKQLLEDTISKKSNELNQRETKVKEREDKVGHFFQNHSKNYVEVRVGSIVYYTSSEILLRVPDSYFHVMLNKKIQEDEKGLFIARDGDTFRYVLEYLTYSKLFSLPPDEGGVKKLLADADFYLLPELAKEIKAMVKARSDCEKIIWMRVGCQESITVSSKINWTSIAHLPTYHFEQKGSITTIKQAGLYHIFVQYEFQCSTYGQGSANVDLLLNGNTIARSYHGTSNNYYDSRSLEYLGEICEGSRIEVLYKSNYNGNPNSDKLATTLTIICLERNNELTD